MIRKIIVSLISACVIAGTIFAVFAALYFIVPNRQSMKELHLAAQVTDADTEADTTPTIQDSMGTGIEELSDSNNIYVADVYQSLTLRSQPDSNSEPLTEDGLPPLTRLEVLEFVPDSNFAYVKVLEGDSKDLCGYVNSEYITREGEPTVRAVNENIYDNSDNYDE